MTTHALNGLIERPARTASYTEKSRFRTVGIGLALVGVALVIVTLIVNVLVATDDVGSDALRWAFGVTTAGFGLLKVGIAVTLMGIIIRLWMRVDSVKFALPQLKAHADHTEPDSYEDVRTPFGNVQHSPEAPGLLPPMVMARKMWAPMLLMGPMLVIAGLVLSIVNAVAEDPETVQAIGAWTQGTQFLGETFLLAAIAFLLGTILAGLRSGGGEVQEALGLTVQTPRLPKTGVFFILLVFSGLLIGLAQFVLYGAVAAWVDNPATWFAWLGPLREIGLGILLAGIVLALYTIGTALGFQHHRIREIIETGR